jgi:hypothetical protein
MVGSSPKRNDKLSAIGLGDRMTTDWDQANVEATRKPELPSSS